MIALFALILMSATGGAERSPHWSTRFATSNWSIAEGLPQTTVTDLAQDERGFLWVTTLGGLVRFDGRTFKRIAARGTEFGNLRFTAVTCLGSTVWVGTEHGRLFRVDDWGAAAPVEVPLERGDDPIWELERSGDTLIVAAGRLGAYAVKDTAQRLSRAHVDHVEVAPDGTLWLLGSGGLECTGPSCAPGTHLSVEDGHSLWLSPEGRPRVLDKAGQVLEVRDGKLELVSSGAPNRLFLVDRSRARAWIAKADEIGIETAGGTEQVLLFHPLRRSQPSGEWRVAIRKLFVDSSGTLWVGTNNAGLFRVRDRHLSQVGVIDGMVGESASLVLPLSSGGALLSTYCHGLQRYAGGRVSTVPTPNETGCVWALGEFGGAAWVAMTGELYRFDPASGAVERVFEDPEAAQGDREEFRAILADPSGDGAWLGTTDGLWRLGREGDELKLRQLWRVADGLPHDTVTALAFDRNADLLVGTLRGAVRLHGGALERLIAPEDDHPAAVRDFWVEERGVTWLATYGEGLARLEPRKGGPQAARWLGTAHGLPSDELSRIVPVDDEVWLNTNRGVLRVEHANLEAGALGKARLEFRLLDSGEGNGGSQTAGGRLSTGQLIFPTVTGLAVIDPDEVRAPRPPLPIFIEQTEVKQRQRDFSVLLAAPHDRWSDLPQVERSLFKDGELKHRDVGGLEATYLDLAPGNYVFEARRLNSAGLTGPPATVPFTLEPTLTERPLVRLIISFILGLAGLGWVRVLRSRASALQAQLVEHERAETARRERDAVYQTVFDGWPGPLILLGPEGALVKLNPAAQQLLGLSQATPGGALLSFLAPGERDAFRELLAQAQQVTRAAEHTLLTQSGERRLVRLALGPLTLGGVPHTLVAATDVTAEREAARQRDALLTRTANAQRLEGLGRLAAGVAHDFNNVLAVLQLELEELRRARPDAQSLPLIDEMQGAIDSGKSLTGRFLVFGRDEGEAPAGPLDDAVAHARPLLGRLLKPDVELVIDCQAAGAAIRLAPAHLDQLLLNLVVNAQDAVGAKGKVTVRTRRGAEARDEEVVVLPPPEGELVELSVEDSGHGMDAATLARAFEPFFTTKDPASGTGMGLAVVHGIATRAGAGLSVRSRVHGGSTFSLQFKLVDQPAAELTGTAPVSAAPGPAAATVLVCEDAAPLRRAMGRLFKSAGFLVLEAANGQQGLELVQGHDVQLVITDLLMPELDGVGLIAALRRRGKTMPILLLSGYPSNTLSQLDEAARAGVTTLQKPVDPPLLVETARRLLARS